MTTVHPDKPHRIQLCPFGEFAKAHEDGTTTVQVCDEQAFRAVLTSWRQADCPKLLMDFDHDRRRTAAGGWIEALEIDPADGLVGTVRYTPEGAAAVNDRSYRFVSVDWLVGADGRPIQLRTVGMTNRQNIPVRPILNAIEANPAPGPAAGATQPQGAKNNMNKIAAALGLPEDAAEDAVLAAIAELDAKAKAAEEAKLEGEAKAVALENAERIENSEAFVKAYKAGPGAVVAALAAMKKPAPVAAPEAPARRVTNSAAAPASLAAAARKFASPEAAKAALAAQPVGKRKEFFAAHASDFEA